MRAPMKVTPYTDVMTVCFTSLRSTCETDRHKSVAAPVSQVPQVDDIHSLALYRLEPTWPRR